MGNRSPIQLARLSEVAGHPPPPDAVDLSAYGVEPVHRYKGRTPDIVVVPAVCELDEDQLVRFCRHVAPLYPDHYRPDYRNYYLWALQCYNAIRDE